MAPFRPHSRRPRARALENGPRSAPAGNGGPHARRATSQPRRPRRHLAGARALPARRPARRRRHPLRGHTLTGTEPGSNFPFLRCALRTACPAAREGGGGRGIRTPGAREGTAVFKTAAIGHSAIPPSRNAPRASRRAVRKLARAGRGRHHSVATASNTSRATRIGAPVCTASAIASDGRQSTVRSLPAAAVPLSRGTSTSVA
jgi:hypothetical protein